MAFLIEIENWQKRFIYALGIRGNPINFSKITRIASEFLPYLSIIEFLKGRKTMEFIKQMEQKNGGETSPCLSLFTYDPFYRHGSR